LISRAPIDNKRNEKRWCSPSLVIIFTQCLLCFLLTLSAFREARCYGVISPCCSLIQFYSGSAVKKYKRRVVEVFLSFIPRSYYNIFRLARGFWIDKKEHPRDGVCFYCYIYAPGGAAFIFAAGYVTLRILTRRLMCRKKISQDLDRFCRFSYPALVYGN